MGTTDDIYGKLFDIGQGASAPDASSNDIYGQIKRIADFVAAGSTLYTNDKYGQLTRIADAIGAAAAGYTPDIYGQLKRIADGIGAPTEGYTLDWYGQLSRIAFTGISGGGSPSDPSLDFSDPDNSQFIPIVT